MHIHRCCGHRIPACLSRSHPVTAVAEAYAWGLPPALRALEPLPLLLALNRRGASLEREGRAIAGPGLPAFCDGDERFFSDDCLSMPG